MELLRDISEEVEGRLDRDKEGKVMQRVLLFREERRDISREVRFLCVCTDRGELGGSGDIGVKVGGDFISLVIILGSVDV